MSEEMEVTDTTVENNISNGNDALDVKAQGSNDESSQVLEGQSAQQSREASIPIEDKAIHSEKSENHEVLQENRAIKRRASTAISDTDKDEFKGFEDLNLNNISSSYCKLLEKLEAEVTEAKENLTPIKNVIVQTKKQRYDTDNSRPSSALSSRSEGDCISTDTTSSPNRARKSIEMSSPMLRMPMDKGWKRELVFRASMDSKRQADIYYYSPTGKKLRSKIEISDALRTNPTSGLTIENFSFSKEPLGMDDPEKEIIRDAKPNRRGDSPGPQAITAVATTNLVESKRTPKPKAPKGASPEPKIKSPPVKLKVKSLGSRLSSTGASPATPVAKQKKPLQQTPTTDNNNSGWKKPRAVGGEMQASASLTAPPTPPPPLQSRPQQVMSSPETPPGRSVQPCSMHCGRGVPSLACSACLLMYHPACVGRPTTADLRLPFYCNNCSKNSPPPLEPPPLVHMSGGAPPSKQKQVILRMKVAGSKGPDGSRLWSVTSPAPPVPRQAFVPPPLRTPAPITPAANRPQPPQSIVTINGRTFIVVQRMVSTQQ